MGRFSYRSSVRTYRSNTVRRSGSAYRTNTGTGKTSSTTLSTGAIIGIVIGSIALIAFCKLFSKFSRNPTKGNKKKGQRASVGPGVESNEPKAEKNCHDSPIKGLQPEKGPSTTGVGMYPPQGQATFRSTQPQNPHGVPGPPVYMHYSPPPYSSCVNPSSHS